jgi:hypothetical protein
MADPYFRLGVKNRSAPAAPKMCRHVFKSKNLAGAPEPTPVRQDPIGGAGSTRQHSPDTMALRDNECGRGQHFL